MTKKIIASALALAFVTGTVMAQESAAPAPGAGAPGAPGAGRGGGRGPAVTPDKDGNILKEDWVKAGRPAEMFDANDKNKDGKLQPDELAALRAAGGGRGGRGGPGGGAPGGQAPAPAQ